jgi:hypothetical protein
MFILHGPQLLRMVLHFIKVPFGHRGWPVELSGVQLRVCQLGVGTERVPDSSAFVCSQHGLLTLLDVRVLHG